VSAPGQDVVSVLRRVDLFAELPAERLDWLAGRAGRVHLATGQHWVHAGQTPTQFAVLARGRLDWYLTVDGRRSLVSSHRPVNYSGTINLLTGEPIAVDGVAGEDSDLLVFARDCLFVLVRDEPGVLQHIVRQVGPNLARGQAVVQQREKLASLGSLSAGLAHEINNPAAAARAATGELRRSVARLREALPALAGLDPEALAALGRLAAQTPGSEEGEDPLAAADREDALGAWLDDHGVQDSWELAAELAGAGLDVGWAERVSAAVSDDALAGVLPWAAAGVTAGALLDELGESLRRVSELVAAIKAYSYMNQAPEQDVDVHEGLESTLTILGHKLKRAQVRVERDFDRSLPRIPAAGSELNQVWTNLIDNAIGAAPGGRIRVSTGRDGDFLRVEVADDGSGIPPEVQERMFEPFFTTKDVGEGTGLGLDVVWRIVVESHGGQVDVASVPGDTRFRVLLPLGGRA